MTLYCMELYRIIHRKLFWGMGLITLGWLIAFFCLESVGGEHAEVNGKVYEGYAAVRIDREITEEYKGRLSDGDVTRIVEEYGFPGKVQEGYGHWMDGNYLNTFAADYLSDGYFYDWEDYKAPQNTILINESRLNAYSGSPEGELPFAYAKGWEKFLEFFQMISWLFSLMMMIGAAPLFCEERQNHMRQLILTSEKGMEIDIRARIAAVFTVSAGGYLFLLLLCLGLCWGVFGLDGGKMYTGTVLGMNPMAPVASYKIQDFSFLYVVTGLGGIMMLTAIVVWISARVDTVAHSLLAAILSWAAPVVLYMAFPSQLLYLLALVQPALMSNYGSINDILPMYWLRLIAVIFVVAAGVMWGMVKWRKIDV